MHWILRYSVIAMAIVATAIWTWNEGGLWKTKCIQQKKENEKGRKSHLQRQSFKHFNIY